MAKSGISVIQPVSLAADWTAKMLFKPFDLSKWFLVGFCAWLATIGNRGGGFNFNFPINNSGSGAGNSSASPAVCPVADIESFVGQNLYWIIPLAIVIVLLITAIALALLWITSRAKFMFVHCVSQNIGQVTEPWNTYKVQGNSLFLFRLVIAIIIFAAVALFAGAIGYVFVIVDNTGQFSFPNIFLLIIAGILFLPLMISIGIVNKFTNDFVVPIMFIAKCRVTQAWSIFWQLFKNYFWQFILYLLFFLLVSMVIGMVTCAATCFTCCITLIPYIGTVILLPLYVFIRSYSLFFLSQFGTDFDVFPGNSFNPVPDTPAQFAPPENINPDNTNQI